MTAAAARVERLFGVRDELLAMKEGVGTAPLEELRASLQRTAELVQEVEGIGAAVDAEEASGHA